MKKVYSKAIDKPAVFPKVSKVVSGKTVSLGMHLKTMAMNKNTGYDRFENRVHGPTSDYSDGVGVFAGY